ncbi:unnamed protein product [Orchesella dallaii]|uniref:Protein kinase domain-containing protein n=1 Tax=Orchesella dallaii TaxID=48710 RepID=A0ABP1PSC5_9HEXA
MLLKIFLVSTVAVETPFSRSNIVVWFDPFVSITDKGSPNAYDIDALIPMISQISTKFSKVIFGRIGEKIEFSKRIIPSAVATFNQFHRPPDQPHLEVMMTFEMTVIENDTVSTNFDMAKRLADEANKIYPETVKSFYIDNQSLSKSKKNIDDANRYFNYIHNLINSTSYKLGAFLSSNDCGRENAPLSSHIPLILPSIKEFIFSVSLSQDDLNQEPEQVASRSGRIIEHCLEKLKVYNSNVSVALYTAWRSDTNQTESDAHDRKLVKFWETLNDWAIATNIPVVLHGAFDTPYKPAKWSKTGWWRLIQNLSYHNSSQYVFEEKRAKLQRKKNKLTLIRDITKLEIKPFDLDATTDKDLTETVADASTNWPIIIASTLLVLFLTVGLAAFITKLFRKGRIKYVDNEELKEFYQGSTSINADAPNGSVPEAHKTPYNKDLELSKSDFTLESNALLGSGAFGTVVRGIIRNFKGTGEDVSVAVKTTKLSSPPTAITGMMSEIKVLGYLGKHDQIVNLIGAYTKEIRRGDVPYGGLSWTPNFVTQLAQGLHLEEPAISERGMYSHMLRCWNMDPSKRPTFSDLKSSMQ